MSEDYSDWEDISYGSSPEQSEDESDDTSEVDIDEERFHHKLDYLLQVGKPVYEKAKKKLDREVEKIEKRKDIDLREKEILKFEAARKIYGTIPNPKDPKRAARDRRQSYVLKRNEIDIYIPDNVSGKINPEDIQYEWSDDIRKFKDWELTSKGKRDNLTQIQKIRDDIKQRTQYDSKTTGEYDLYDRSIAERVGQTLGPTGYNVGLTDDITPEDEEISKILRNPNNPNNPPIYGGRMGKITPREPGRFGTMYLNPSPTVHSRGTNIQTLNDVTRDFIEKKKEEKKSI